MHPTQLLQLRRNTLDSYVIPNNHVNRLFERMEEISQATENNENDYLVRQHRLAQWLKSITPAAPDAVIRLDPSCAAQPTVQVCGTWGVPKGMHSNVFHIENDADVTEVLTAVAALCNAGDDCWQSTARKGRLWRTIYRIIGTTVPIDQTASINYEPGLSIYITTAPRED